MAKYNVGDEITSTEQLQELPVDTILKLVPKDGQSKDGRRTNVGIIQGGAWTSSARLETLNDYYAPGEYSRLLGAYSSTIVYLPPREWKVGDRICNVKELEEQTVGVVVETGRSASAGVYRRSANCWFSTLDGCEYESEALARLQPLTIIRIPEN